MWPGVNFPGGVGRITNLHYTEGMIEDVQKIDVKYVLGITTAKAGSHVDLEYVKAYEDLGRQSRSRRGRDFFQAIPGKRKREEVERLEKQTKELAAKPKSNKSAPTNAAPALVEHSDSLTNGPTQAPTRPTELTAVPKRKREEAEKLEKQLEKERVKKTKEAKVPPTKAAAAPAECSDETKNVPTPATKRPKGLPGVVLCPEPQDISPLQTLEAVDGCPGKTGAKKSLFAQQFPTINQSQSHDDSSDKTSYIIRKMVKQNFCSSKKVEASTQLQDAVKAAKMATIGGQSENYVLDYDVDTERNKIKALAQERKAASAIAKAAIAAAKHCEVNDENAKPAATKTKALLRPALLSPDSLPKKRVIPRPLPLQKYSPARRLIVSSNSNANQISIGASTKARIPLQEVHQNEINRAGAFVRDVVGTKKFLVSIDTAMPEKSVVGVNPLVEQS
jgi:hypothetical protein